MAKTVNTVKVLIVLSIPFYIRGGSTKKKCRGLVYDNVCHDIKVLKRQIKEPINLVVEYGTNNLYFSYEAEQYFKTTTARINLNTGLFTTIYNIPNGFVQTVDRKTGSVYIGGSDGIYKISSRINNNKARLYAANQTVIQALFHKYALYFTDFFSMGLYVVKSEDEFDIFEDFGHISMRSLVIDNNYVFYYFNDTGLYIQEVGTATSKATLISDYYPLMRCLSVDSIGDIYVCLGDGIYKFNKTVSQLQRVLITYEPYGLAFDKSNNVIFSNASHIVVLQKKKEKKGSRKRKYEYEPKAARKRPELDFGEHNLMNFVSTNFGPKLNQVDEKPFLDIGPQDETDFIEIYQDDTDGPSENINRSYAELNQFTKKIVPQINPIVNHQFDDSNAKIIKKIIPEDDHNSVHYVYINSAQQSDLMKNLDINKKTATQITPKVTDQLDHINSKTARQIIQKDNQNSVQYVYLNSAQKTELMKDLDKHANKNFTSKFAYNSVIKPTNGNSAEQIGGNFAQYNKPRDNNITKHNINNFLQKINQFRVLYNGDKLYHHTNRTFSRKIGQRNEKVKPEICYKEDNERIVSDDINYDNKYMPEDHSMENESEYFETKYAPKITSMEDNPEYVVFDDTNYSKRNYPKINSRKGNSNDYVLDETNYGKQYNFPKTDSKRRNSYVSFSDDIPKEQKNVTKKKLHKKRKTHRLKNKSKNNDPDNLTLRKRTNDKISSSKTKSKKVKHKKKPVTKTNKSFKNHRHEDITEKISYIKAMSTIESDLHDEKFMRKISQKDKHLRNKDNVDRSVTWKNDEGWVGVARKTGKVIQPRNVDMRQFFRTDDEDII